MAKREEPQGRFAIALSEALEQKGMSINDLADAIDSTYEHTRKLLKGMAFPSKYMMKVICQKLNLDEKQMEEHLVGDKIRHKYGTVPMTIAGKNPKFEAVESKISRLNDTNLRTLESILEGMIQAQRREAAGSDKPALKAEKATTRK